MTMSAALTALTAPSVLHFADPLPAPAHDQPAADRCLGQPPQRTTWELYGGEGGALSIGLWACQPGAWRIRFHAHRHEFFQVLRGRLRISDESGLAREFGPGEAGVIPAGFVGVFTVLEAVEKRYVMFERA